MLAQDFGPVRLMLPHVDTAIGWRRVLLALKAAAFTDPVEAHLALAGWCAGAAAALSADTDSEGRPQTWGDQARGKAAGDLRSDPEAIAIAVAGLMELGASYSELVSLGDEIVSWLTSEILAPVEAAPERARFFARPKAS